jgi:protein phosphatase
LHIVARTDVGLVRKRNEDYYVVADSLDLVVLCDGMGGHPGGDVASRMVAEEVERLVKAGDETTEFKASEAPPEVRPFVVLLHAVFCADRKLRAYGQQHPQYQGMGTTLITMQEDNGTVCVVHVGDSRVYSFRNGRLKQVTNDHSVVATHPEYAHLAGMRNILTRAMGVGDELEVDFKIAPIHKDELYLLCTDGLHNYVSEERIVEILASDASAEARADQLITEAKNGGGGDNVTLSLAWGTPDANEDGPSLAGMVTESESGMTVQLEPSA